MKIYIVTARCGNEMEAPVVFKDRKEAEKNAEEYILDAARDSYDGPSLNPTNQTLYRWADRNGYNLFENYFWDGSSCAYESMVTEVEV